MISASMDRKITLQQKTEAANDYGELEETWTDIAEVWANKKDVRNSEGWKSGQTAAEVETVFLIRYRSGITPTDRITYGGRTYDILGVSEIGRRDGLEIKAKARAE